MGGRIKIPKRLFLEPSGNLHKKIRKGISDILNKSDESVNCRCILTEVKIPEENIFPKKKLDSSTEDHLKILEAL